ncbi:MAG: ABC transporter ATP-binding protein [Deltaproteobacteria bacterium]|nr:ABC transporter ATP-binding protein [Deltaproteobacteria bacterium]
MPPAIEIRGLRKVYRTGFWMRPHVGLESLDLEIGRGEVFGFIGPNGAGKTTAIRCLVGLQAPTAGEARILGLDARWPLARRRLGFLPERPSFHPHLTARELLDFHARLFDLPAAERRRRTAHLLERVDLGRFADIRVSRFSKGMIQRVGVAQALVQDPEVLVLDEPMSGLDPPGRALVRDIVLEERRRGHTVFFSSHILPDIESICDRVGVLLEGRLQAEGTVASLLADGVAYVDCTVIGPEDPPLGATVLARQQDRWVLRVPPDGVAPLLRDVLAAGGRVLQVTPGRRSLEDLLLDEVARARPVHQQRLGVLA